LPVEVVRIRVRRAAEIGLDYRTYAGIRASTGHDLVAFLFSSNALNMLREGQRAEASRAAKLRGLHAVALAAAVQPPLGPARAARLLAEDGIEVAAGPAPGLSASWGAVRAGVRAILAGEGHPMDRVLLVGETAIEREWAEAARLAGFLPAEAYFGICAQSGA
jgi:hypothetical protein